mgnify:CR=1 FL=1
MEMSNFSITFAVMHRIPAQKSFQAKLGLELMTCYKCKFMLCSMFKGERGIEKHETEQRAGTIHEMQQSN